MTTKEEIKMSLLLQKRDISERYKGNLLSIEQDAKTRKGTAFGVLTAILYLKHAHTSGHNVCPSATEGCILACFEDEGLGKRHNVRKARMDKTRFLFRNRPAFLAQLKEELGRFERKAKRRNMTPAVRLNGTSDLGWEGFARDVIESFPSLTFYDYTKVEQRMRRFLAGKFPSNYRSLTFSRSESNWPTCLEILGMGGNVAAVFDKLPGQPLPESYAGYPVIDGDQNDIRFLDPGGVIIGLHLKGHTAKRDETGFVIRT